MSVPSFLKNFLAKIKLKHWTAGVAILALAATGGLFYLSLYQFKRQLKDEMARAAGAARISVKTGTGERLAVDGLRLAVTAREPRAMCRFGADYYVATAGGLLVYDEQGALRHHYTIIDGLPSLDLVALAVYRDRLFIGSAGGGLASFDGRDFTVYQFEQPAVRQVSALAVEDEQLVIGSFDNGLFSFDGEKFTRRDFIKPIGQITTLLPHAGRLYVGTHANGLHIWQEGRWRQISAQEGLASNRITALLGHERGVIAATDFGVVLVSGEGQVRPLNATPNITSLVRAQDRVWAGLFTGGLVEIDTSGTTGNRGLFSSKPQGLTAGNTRLWLSDEKTLFALTREGLARADLTRAQMEFANFGALPAAAPLAAAHISALALDEQGRLWIGYFDRGIDIFNTETMETITHIEDQSVREINYIRRDEETGSMLVATAAGLAVFDAQLQYRMIDERAGISSNAVAHVAIMPAADTRADNRQLVLATGRGLTLLQGAVARTPISLPNNYLYTSALLGRRLFLGSLGGLIEMEGLRAVRTFTNSNSKLSHNWINALVAVNGTLYIGTNGGGVDALLPSGELINYAGEIGKFDVNPNAMHSDGNRLYVGSLGNGVYVLDLASREWQRLRRGLTALDVGAIASDERYIYFGTSNGLARFERRSLAFN